MEQGCWEEGDTGSECAAAGITEYVGLSCSQVLIEPVHECGVRSLFVLSLKRMGRPFDHDQFAGNGIRLERLEDAFAVTERDEFILISVNQQRRGIILRNMQ